ncbi:MAG: DUF2490 domain-containing protein [Bacteroidia bacterium]|nr:DUF2490 domain-containing protein [Bacteroidia bacterium]
MKKLSTLISLCIVTAGFAQPQTTYHQQLIWYCWFETITLSNRWYIQAEVQERHFINPFAPHQFLLRAHLHRTWEKTGWEASAGFCSFFHNPNLPDAAVKLTVPELRPHAEAACRHSFGRLSCEHRLRTEARFFHHVNAAGNALAEDYYFSAFRFRYRLQFTYPLFRINNSHEVKLKLSNEYHLQAGGETGEPDFDQNRLYGGLSMAVTPSLTIDAGYMHWYQHRQPDVIFNRDIIRFTVFHRINAGRKS